MSLNSQQSRHQVQILNEEKSVFSSQLLYHWTAAAVNHSVCHLVCLSIFIFINFLFSLFASFFTIF